MLDLRKIYMFSLFQGLIFYTLLDKWVFNSFLSFKYILVSKAFISNIYSTENLCPYLSSLLQNSGMLHTRSVSFLIPSHL